MRIISGNAPRGVISAGVYYPVRTDFKVWLEFAALLEEKDSARAATRALRLCYKTKIPPDFGEALELLCEFFLGGECRQGSGRGGQVMSFVKDEGLIYASFYAEYGIDLVKAQMHWWQFLALMRGLSSESALMRVASVRAIKPSDIKNPALRKRILEQKRIYAIDSREADVGGALSAMFAQETEAENG